MSNLTPPPTQTERPRVEKLCPCGCRTLTTKMVCRTAWTTVPKEVKDQLASPDREHRLTAARAVFSHAADIKRQRAAVYTPDNH